ncbi:hypothetical protein C6H88_00085 [Chlamydia muridarum str. Nigg]|jgi:hypothetical protein|uniref:Lipoprotein n=2 Tax=Chlamydia muridarum TaxID=83560 RepID=A0A070A5K7_CHLMR|nr:hypothetical protein [Chlamydia muridarum]UFU86871.1 hypothetical protein FTN28_00085 [Chlamydia trachomatis]AAF38909.1 conserved hypothetical protein [Chlamydia muridarum str. Nigg]AHH22416.1 hypothetical protein TAC_00085 [Chlamydia muridarum str. Nigg3 CMUT3-5]AHH23340.1 hypothetical protein Y015_00085 [Chlamydia muridarum str. Nigg CM972]AID37569.1 hypothetical protein BB17_00090 [Chlamydia muridarum str. Nigg 2 MCR]
MRRIGVVVLLFFASCVASLPALGVWCWRQCSSEAWGSLLLDMRAIQRKRDHLHQLSANNTLLKAARQQVSFSDWIERGEQLVFLNKERGALAKFPVAAWDARSRAIQERKAFLKDNRLLWSEQALGGGSTLYSLQKAIQIDSEDIPLLLALFDSRQAQIPIVFLSYWEMTKQISSLGNEVWVVHAEAWGRCV